MDKARTAAPVDGAAEPYLRLAKFYENIAETYRNVRLHRPADDAEGWKGACQFLSGLVGQRDEKQAA